MSDETSQFDLLKHYDGLVHRQPLFSTHGLNVVQYHFRFLDNHGNALPADLEAPAFLSSFHDFLSSLNTYNQVMLSVPASWQEAIAAHATASMRFTFVLNQDESSLVSDNNYIRYARFATDDNSGHDGDLLLVDLKKENLASATANLADWQTQAGELCAINVNHPDSYTFCQTHKLAYCQGDFYTLPAISERKKMSPSIQTLTELLVKLQNPDIEPEELADTVNQDVALSYKLLRLINSAFFGLPREVNSTQQAIVMLGQSKIKTWASLLGLSGIDDKPVELRLVAMTRARMCELLAKFYKGQPEVFFAAGLFSTLDALMDTPLIELVEKLPLAPELKTALLEKEGPIGHALRDTLHYEQENWSAIANSSVPTTELVQTYLDALQWSHELNAQLS